MTTKQNSLSRTIALENILIVGSGGRENSLAWCFSKSKSVKNIFITPGNAGSEVFKKCSRLSIKESDFNLVSDFCIKNKIDLVVIGPEVPLSKGLGNILRNKGIKVFGPNEDGAQIESSKNWAKELMNENNIPTAKHSFFKNPSDAKEFVYQQNAPFVVKADGLASGKGVIVPNNIEETIKAIDIAFSEKYKNSNNLVILEEILSGPEVSIFGLCDGNRMVILPPAQDHKRLLDGDKGPNTGGMGAYAPATLVTTDDLLNFKKIILDPTLQGLKQRGIDYRGVIYAGLMLTKDGPKVIEFNCRFGDPECQALMPLMPENFPEIILSCASGNLKDESIISSNRYHSACIVATTDGYPGNPKLGDKITMGTSTEGENQIFQAGTEINKEGQLITSGGRVLSAVGQGGDFDQAFSNAYSLIKNVYFKGMFFRKDIGYQVRSDTRSTSS